MLVVLMTADHIASPRLTAELTLHEIEELRALIRTVVASILREHVHHPDVEDCTHETLRRALEGEERLREPNALRSWVVGIARHVALDTIRARKKQSLRIVSNQSEQDVSYPDPQPMADEVLERARQHALVQQAMQSLPETTRKALVMFHLEGKSYQEIADLLHVPLGSVATWVTRGRKLIAQRLNLQASPGDLS
jgi:RNA polymerase sigma factor (sigma-70 family)